MDRSARTYGLSEFLGYLRIGLPRTDDIEVVCYDEHADMRLQSPPVGIDFYFISLKDGAPGKRSAAHKGDTYLFVDRPGNVLEWDFPIAATGYAMLLGKDLLGTQARAYSFMDYSMHEALYLTKEERAVLLDLFKKAHAEFRKEHAAKEILVSYATLILSYARSFYERQFASRSKQYNRVVADFYGHLEAYFGENKQVAQLPTVGYFAGKVNLSVNYFGDLIKQYTGSSPQEHIHRHIIHLAKAELRNSQRSVSEIAYGLGFEYPTYFTRFFRKETGITPTVFREQ